MALLRVEEHNIEEIKSFIKHASMQLKQLSKNTLLLFGPIPAIIEKHGGRFSYQLIIQATNIKILHEHIDEWLKNLEKTKNSKKVRWSLDIDPQDMN